MYEKICAVLKGDVHFKTNPERASFVERLSEECRSLVPSLQALQSIHWPLFYCSCTQCFTAILQRAKIPEISQ